MNAFTFDTLKLARGLETAGFPHEQALKTAEVFAETMGTEVATKSDLRELEHHLEAKIAAVRTEIGTAKAEILKWMFGGMLGQIAVLAALIKLL